jgi:transcriptional regulator with XRE-family HTH domain
MTQNGKSIKKLLKDKTVRDKLVSDSVAKLFSKQMKAIRKDRQFSIKALAKHLDVSIKTIKNIERRKINEVELTELVKLSHALDCAVEVKLIKHSALDLNTPHSIPPTFEEETNRVLLKA